MSERTEGSAAPFRDPACIERWPECESGAYDPRCCRFPKSCSCTVYQPSEPDAATPRNSPVPLVGTPRKERYHRGPRPLPEPSKTGRIVESRG